MKPNKAAVLPPVHRWVIAALTVATVLVYAPALSAPFVMDDVSAVTESTTPGVRIPAGSPVAGRPVVRATLALNHAVNDLLGVDQRPDPDGPRKTAGYRLLNIFFHLCTGALLFGVLRRAMRERSVPEEWRAIADPLAGAACALWLLHPIQTEAINYVVQRTELIASLMYIATLYASLRAWEARSAKRRLGWYAMAVLACALGMMSKEIVISAPLAVILYDRAFKLPEWSAIRTPGQGRGWLYFALAVTCIASFAIVAAGGRGVTAGFASSMRWQDYLYSQCWAVTHYLRLVIWPNALAIDYGEQAITGSRGVSGAVFLAAFGAATLVAWMRVARWGWFAFAGSWFFMLLAPSSSFVPIATEIAAERRIYLALAAVMLLVVVGAEWVRGRYAKAASRAQVRATFGLLLAALAALAALAVTTAARSAAYANPESLWRSDVLAVPENLRGVVNLASALMREQPPKNEEAEALLRRAIAADTSCRNGCAELGGLLGAQGRTTEASVMLEKALAHDPRNALAERRLSLILMKDGSFDRALPHVEHLAALYPTEQNLVVLGVVYFVLQQQQRGILAFENASRLFPANAEIRSLGNTVFAAGRSAEALPHLRELALSLAKDWQ